MRHRIQKLRGNVMHRALFLTLSWWLVLEFVFVIGAEGLTATTITTTTTTTRPRTNSAITSSSTSRRGSRTSPKVSVVIDKSKRQTTLLKRNGPYSGSTEEDDGQNREPLYDATGFEEQSYNHNRQIQRQEDRLEKLYGNHDNEDMSHFYSPIKRQRYRKKFQGTPEPATPTAASYDYPLSQPSPQFQDFSQQPQQPAPKNYAFAYAVRDDQNAEDFSHKEARDGKLTMGEYRINLPDGRVQVVRYTAGGKLGYKADVTYEGDDPRNQQLTKPEGLKNDEHTPGSPHYSGSPSSSVQKKYRPQSSSPISDPYKNDYGGPVYRSRPLKSRRPSVSPSSQYNHESHPLSPSPTPTAYKAGPYRSPSPTTASFYNGIGSTGRPKSIYDKMSSPEKYDGNLSFLHEKSPRAGPSRSYTQDTSPTKESYYSNPTKEPFYSNPHKSTFYTSPSKAPFYSSPTKEPFYSTISKDTYYLNPTKASYNSNQDKSGLYNGQGSYYSTRGTSSPSRKPFADYSSNSNFGSLRDPKPTKNYLEENTAGIGTSSYTPIRSSGKGGELIPIEDFKAGPSRKKLRKPKSKQALQDFQPSYPQLDPIPQNSRGQNYQYQNQNLGQQSFEPSFNSPSSVSYKEPFHYYNSQHASYHHGGYTPPTPPVGHSQLHVNPTSEAYYEDLPAGKQSFYLKAGPGRPKQGRRGRKKTSSGLVYLETPGVGPRPTALGVKDILSKLPNMPDPKTSIHPYEVGSRDYGNSVGYSNSANRNKYSKPTYVPYVNSNDFDEDHGPSYHREYLFDSTPDSIVQAPIDSSSMSGVEQDADSAFRFEIK